MRPVLVVMLKLPQVGRVKTRLGADIGIVQATWWFRHQTKRLLQRLGTDPRWETVLAVAPDVAGMQASLWGAELARIPQGHGDLGARMGRVFQNFRTSPTLIIGADIPGISRSHTANAFQRLGAHDAVLGPAPDGGYWAIGLRQGATPPPSTLFQNVRWSSAHTMQDTINSIGGRRIAFLPELRDVDRAKDLP